MTNFSLDSLVGQLSGTNSEQFNIGSDYLRGYLILHLLVLVIVSLHHVREHFGEKVILNNVKVFIFFVFINDDDTSNFNTQSHFIGSFNI